MADAEREEQGGERAPAGGVDRRDQVARGDLGEAVQREELLGAERVQIGDVLHQALAQELLDGPFAQAADVHGALRGEVHEAPVDAFRARAVRAIGHHLARGPLDGRPAAGALLGRLERLLAAVAPLDQRPHDLRDHLARALDQDHVPDAEVLAGDVIEVVQRGELDRRAGDLDGLEHRVRVERARAAHVDPDVEQPGDGHVGRELVGDGPAGLAFADHAELGPELERLHLDDDAVDRVVERVAPILCLSGVGDDLLEVAAQAAVRLDGEAPLREEIEDLGLRGGQPVRAARGVDVHLEREEAERP